MPAPSLPLCFIRQELRFHSVIGPVGLQREDGDRVVYFSPAVALNRGYLSLAVQRAFNLWAIFISCLDMAVLGIDQEGCYVCDTMFFTLLSSLL